MFSVPDGKYFPLEFVPEAIGEPMSAQQLSVILPWFDSMLIVFVCPFPSSLLGSKSTLFSVTDYSDMFSCHTFCCLVLYNVLEMASV